MDDPPGYDDAVRETLGNETIISVAMEFPGCKGFIDADSWGHPSPWTRSFDFELRITADLAYAAATDDPAATLNYAQLSNLVDKSLKDSTRRPLAAENCYSRPYHLTAFAWHAKLADYIVCTWGKPYSATMKSTFPIARAGADAKVTYASDLVLRHQVPFEDRPQGHYATMTITNMRALVGFGHKARDHEMRQVALISLKLRLTLPTSRSQLDNLMPGGAHNLVEAVVTRVNDQPHFHTLNRLATVVRNIVNDELARHSYDDQLRPLPGELYQEMRIPPHPFRIDAPTRLAWLKIEAPNHLDTSKVGIEIDFEARARATGGTDFSPLQASSQSSTQPVPMIQESYEDTELSSNHHHPDDTQSPPQQHGSPRQSPLERAVLSVSHWWNGHETPAGAGPNIV